jgi:hypothetical protein
LLRRASIVSCEVESCGVITITNIAQFDSLG